jgi:hypothetical protein
VKRGIEDGHLGNYAEKIFDYLYALQFGANVQWRESRDTLNGRSHLVRDYYGVLKMRAAMDHTVSYRVDLQSRADGTRVPIMQRAQQVSDHLLARGDRQFFF